MTSHRILILFAHPALERSRVNEVLVAAAGEVAGVRVHDLYEAYPDMDIDVPREQRLLLDADVVVWQHPLYWYSTPAILKEWQDLVLQHGWAYGSEGTALHGKRLATAVTTGAPIQAYCGESPGRCTLEQLFVPIAQTAALCGMTYGPHFTVHGTHGITAEEIEAHAANYVRFLEDLRDGS